MTVKTFPAHQRELAANHLAILRGSYSAARYALDYAAREGSYGMRDGTTVDYDPIDGWEITSA